MSRAEDQATKIAEAASSVWYRSHGSGDTEIPLATVAVLALVRPPRERRAPLAEGMIALDVADFAELIRTLWGAFVVERPDLAVPAWPLISPWWGSAHRITEGQMEASRDVAHAVLRAGIFALDTQETDLLGTTLTLLRPPVALQQRGQYYTPPDVCELLVRVLGGASSGGDVAAPEAGDAITDPTCGTGGLFRTTAQAMRAAGRDPASAAWAGCDIDPLAVAGVAVNAELWGLGRDVLFGVGDTLVGGWEPRAIAERSEVLTAWRHLRAIRAVQALVKPTANDIDTARSA